MLSIKKMNKITIKQTHLFLKDLEPENGFENRFFHMPFDTFEQDAFPQLIKESKGIDLAEGRVPQTYFFLWLDRIIIGVFKVRHYLNDTLKNGAGHIGYAIHKDYRRKGYATMGLALTLKKARKLIKEDEIYLSCAHHNVGSYRAQINNGAYVYQRDDEKILLRIKK